MDNDTPPVPPAKCFKDAQDARVLFLADSIPVQKSIRKNERPLQIACNYLSRDMTNIDWKQLDQCPNPFQPQTMCDPVHECVRECVRACVCACKRERERECERMKAERGCKREA